MSPYGFAAEREAVREFLGRDLRVIEETSGRTAEIAVAPFVLGGGAVPEITAQVLHGGYCGSGGCLLVVLRAEVSGGWTPILQTSAATLEVSSERTHGYRDLVVVDGREKKHAYVWNGQTYVERKSP